MLCCPSRTYGDLFGIKSERFGGLKWLDGTRIPLPFRIGFLAVGGDTCGDGIAAAREFREGVE